MLAPHGEPQRLGGGGLQFVEPGGHPAGVEQLVGNRLAVDERRVRVLCVGGVECVDRRAEAGAGIEVWVGHDNGPVGGENAKTRRGEGTRRRKTGLCGGRFT
jgi:hypothetical protein